MSALRRFDKRYDDWCMEEYDDGPFVYYDDIKHLETRNKKLEEALRLVLNKIDDHPSTVMPEEWFTNAMKLLEQKEGV